MNALIIAGGQQDKELLCKLIKNGGYDLILAADSGMDTLYELKLTPNVIVGDFDSANQEVLEYYRQNEVTELVCLNPEKDDTDTEHAIRDAISRGMDDLTIVGATGSRLDHVLANLSLLGIGLEQEVDMEIIDTHNRVRMVNTGVTIKKSEQYGEYISLIPVSKEVKNLNLTGFKYDLKDYTLTGFNSLGVSNEIIAEEGTIDFSDGILLVIEARD